MKNLRALRALFFVMLATIGTTVPGRAMDRTNDYYGMNPSSGWWLQMERDVRLGVGQFMFNALGNSAAGLWSNLAITPSSGLYVQVSPAGTNQQGSLYQYGADDLNAIGSGATQLAADPTLTELQGLLTTPALSIGPFTPPSASPNVVKDLIECQINPAVSRTPQSEYFETIISGTQPTSVVQTANRDLADIFACQIKVGTAVASSLTPAAPAADSGWVSVATVTVASGATSIATQNIAMNTATEFFGFIPANASGTLPVSYLPHGDYVDISNTSQAKAGAFSSLLLTSLGSLITGNGQTIATSGLPLRLCANATCTSMPYVNTNGDFVVLGNVYGTQGNFTSGLTATTGIFSAGVSGLSGAFGGGSYAASSNQLLLGNDGSNSYLRSGQGGIYLQNANGSTTFASLTSSGASVNGNLAAVQGNFSSGLTASTGSFSAGVTAPSFTANNVISASNFSASGGYISGNGVFNSTVASADICLNNGATCPFLEDQYGTHFSGAGTAVYLGAYGADENGGGGQLAFGTSATGSTTIGASYSTSIRGINGGVLRVGECTSSGGSACNVSSQTDFTIDTNGNVAALNNMYAGAFSQNSLRALKRDIHPVLDDPLSVIQTVSPQWWNYKTDKRGEPQRLGIIADDTHPDISGPKKDHLDVGALAVMDAAAINKLHGTIDRQQAEISELEQDVRRLTSRRTAFR